MNPILVKQLRFLLCGIACLLALFQVIVFPTAENFSANAIVLGTTLAVVLTMVRAQLFTNYPISTLQILFFCACSVSLPPLATLIDGNPLIINLQQPNRTFSFLAFTAAVFVATHFFYRTYFQTFRRTVSTAYIQKLGLFQVPSNTQIWILSVVGLIAMAATRLTASEFQSAQGGGVGFVGKFIQGLTFFAYSPFAVPFLSAIQRTPQRFKSGDFVAPGIYFLFILVISLGANTRGAILFPILMIVFTSILLVSSGILSYKAFKSKLWLGVGILGIIGLVMLSDLALAMQIARAERGKISPVQMMQLSAEIYGDSERLDRYRGELSSGRGRTFWDEKYVNNILLSRFVTTKFHDLCLSFESKYDADDRQKLRHFHMARLIAIYPAPLVNLLPLPIKKSSLGIVSGGDMMFFLGTGVGLGGLRTGSMVAQGYGMWHWMFFPILAVLAAIGFTLSDSLVLTSHTRSRNTSNPGVPIISFLALINVFQYVNFLVPETVDGFFSFILRGFWQTTLLSALLLLSTSFFAAKARRTIVPRANHQRNL